MNTNNTRMINQLKKHRLVKLLEERTQITLEDLLTHRLVIRKPEPHADRMKRLVDHAVKNNLSSSNYIDAEFWPEAPKFWPLTFISDEIDKKWPLVDRLNRIVTTERFDDLKIKANKTENLTQEEENERSRARIEFGYIRRQDYELVHTAALLVMFTTSQHMFNAYEIKAISDHLAEAERILIYVAPQIQGRTLGGTKTAKQRIKVKEENRIKVVKEWKKVSHKPEHERCNLIA